MKFFSFQARASSQSRTFDCATSIATIYNTVSKNTTRTSCKYQRESGKNAKRERQKEVFTLRRGIR